MTSRRFSTVVMVITVGAMAWIYWDREVSKRLLREANALIDEAVALSVAAAEKNNAVDTISSDERIKSNRPAVEAAAREAAAASRAVAVKYRQAADATNSLIDRATNDTTRLVFRKRREFLVKMAESADAVADSHETWSLSTVVDRQSNFAAMWPHTRRAVAARDHADELKAAAKALEDSYRSGR
jgi:hypothetical protein